MKEGEREKGGREDCWRERVGGGREDEGGRGVRRRE